MKLSFIIPAFNEEKRLGACLQALHQALCALPDRLVDSQVIVVDNNSTDRTAAIAREQGVTVVFEPINQISAARNAGGAAATGEWLIFIDADTLVTVGTLDEMLSLIRSGRCVGGGTMLRYDREPPLWKALLFVANRMILPFLRWTPGCFLFCRTDAFRDFGGFDRELFAGEDVEFGRAMRRWGRRQGLELVHLRKHPPVTSIRKLDLYGSAEIFTLMFRWLVFPRATGKDKSKLRVFYDGRR